MTLKVLGETPLYLETQSEVHEYLAAVFAEGDRLKSSTDMTFQVIGDVVVHRMASLRQTMHSPSESISVRGAEEFSGIVMEFSLIAYLPRSATMSRTTHGFP
ncbi:hypothetical protein ABZ745_31755 [Streptomyces sp. NPDC013082]|uniref:hypothetical protein n=1 Tax=Streptomyces sp. NPDC013082 TaxID=3156686 RepID=UPI003404436A